MTDKFSQNKVLIGVLLAVLATIIWSGNFIIARGVIEEIPPVTLAFYRWVTATLILLPFVWNTIRKEWPLVKNRLWYFILAAVAGVTLFNTFVYIAGHYSDAINLALIGTTSSPIMSVILARIFLNEKITWLRVLGLLVCIAGVLTLLSMGHWEKLLSLSFSKGDWWMLGAAFTFAVYNVSAKRKPKSMSNSNFLFTVFLIGTICLLPFYIMEWQSKGGIAINFSNIAAIVYLGLGASVICFLLWNIAIGHLGAGRASLFGNLIPVFSSIEAVIILQEKIKGYHIASFLLVIAGLVVANMQKRKTAWPNK